MHTIPLRVVVRCVLCAAASAAQQPKRRRCCPAAPSVRRDAAWRVPLPCLPLSSNEVSWHAGRYYHNLRPGGSTSGRGLNTTHFFDHDAVFPTLHRAGYQTALFGKIHNNQAEWLCHPTNHTEPFTHIETECSPCGNYFPRAFVTKSADSIHTAMETLAPNDPRTNYSHAQYGNRSVAFIKQAAKDQKPWFVFVGTTGPHLPAQPAPWHQAIADNLKGPDGV